MEVILQEDSRTNLTSLVPRPPPSFVTGSVKSGESLGRRLQSATGCQSIQGRSLHFQANRGEGLGTPRYWIRTVDICFIQLSTLSQLT